jgi:cbb3-type cytochrome oxidase maturation protein
LSFLAVTLPVSLAIAAVMLWLVVRAVREGQFEDWEGPAARHLFDDDETPELEGEGLRIELEPDPPKGGD